LLKRLGKGLADTWGAVDDSGPVMTVWQGDSAWDSSCYNMASVNSYKILFVMTGAAFDNISILKCMVGSMLISIGVAMLACYQEHALFIEMDRVHTLGTFLNVFVGMLLGFFVSSAMNRWYGCCQGFMDLLEAIRCLQMQMFALGVDIDLINKLNRYGTLSAWLLHFSLNSECKKNPREERVDMTEEEQKEALWSTLESIRPNLALPHEKEMLYRFLDCYGLLWTWIPSLIGRMAQDGHTPPMASPTYGRLINLVEWAYGSIRDVRSMHRIKAPFVYVHTLAILVHFNTMLNSVSFGMILGMTVKVGSQWGESPLQSKLPALVTSVFMQFCISMVAPFLYLCLLEVSVCVSQPFIFMDSKIPSQQLIQRLEEDLVNAKDMADNTKWEKPRFKK